MALRVRNGTGPVLCAAQSDPEPGDTYLDDAVHHLLHTTWGILATDDEGDTWRLRLPWEAHRPCCVGKSNSTANSTRTGCGSEIDPDVCGCGTARSDHDSAWHFGHLFIPMGCNCLRVNP